MIAVQQLVVGLDVPLSMHPIPEFTFRVGKGVISGAYRPPPLPNQEITKTLFTSAAERVVRQVVLKSDSLCFFLAILKEERRFRGPIMASNLEHCLYIVQLPLLDFSLPNKNRQIWIFPLIFFSDPDPFLFLEQNKPLLNFTKILLQFISHNLRHVQTNLIYRIYEPSLALLELEVLSSNPSKQTINDQLLIILEGEVVLDIVVL